MSTFNLFVNYVDLIKEDIYPVTITIDGSQISSIQPVGQHIDPSLPYILPGFIDAHVHIESSMLIPTEFARLASVHGTVATISDPHEIANVLGVEGVEFMIQNGKKSPFKFFFGAPSCVPATPFETAGARIDAREIASLLKHNDIYFLSEMMNYPAVLRDDEEVLKKIDAARHLEKPIDGHAPGLQGEEARRYAEAGVPGKATISTDHECFTREEALDKLHAGMKIIIREGSAARNFDALIDLLKDYPNDMMFCSDDKHPDSLEAGHINLLVKKAVQKGIPIFNVLKAACLNPILHYNIPVGLLQERSLADFILVEDLIDFKVTATYIEGEKIAENGKTLLPSMTFNPINKFNCSAKRPEDFVVSAKQDTSTLKVIEATDGSLITQTAHLHAVVEDNQVVACPEKDILKLTVVNRYNNAAPAVAFIKNFGLRSGAIASSVAHDSHNIIAVGADDLSLCRAVNLIIENKGGICAVNNEEETILPLPVAGLMSDENGYWVARMYANLDETARRMGSPLEAPFMTLSFMALLVIPSLKLSDKGLFDGEAFDFTQLLQ